MANDNMKCDICGDSTNTVWFMGVCRCRDDLACAKRAPETWEGVMEERREKWQNNTIGGAIYTALRKAIYG